MCMDVELNADGAGSALACCPRGPLGVAPAALGLRGLADVRKLRTA